MLDFPTSFLGWLVVTAVPTFLGLLAITLVGRRSAHGRYLAAFTLGIFFWFFVDTIGGAANLDVNAGFAGGAAQVAIVGLFALGLLFFFAVSGDLLISSPGPQNSLTIPLLVAIAVGIHGFGEGTAFGATAISTQSTSLLDSFGGLTAGIAYFLHKLLEPMMIGACYAVYAGDRASGTVAYLKDLLLLTVPFVVPSLIGAATGYFASYDASYFFALGTGTSIYAALRLAKPLFMNNNTAGARDSIMIGIMIIVGFLCIYFAALFHS